MTKLETHSVVFISRHENPILLEENTFLQNVGIFGGAVAIDTPNFVYGDYGVDPKTDFNMKPFAVFKANNFTLNQAYASGNALYVRNTRQDGATKETKKVCGAGMHIENNNFLDNTAVNHASNGGAVSLECDFVSIERSQDGASDLMFSTWDQ